MTNQKCGVVGSFADLMTVRSVITVGTIAAIRKFIDRIRCRRRQPSSFVKAGGKRGSAQCSKA